MSSYGKNEYGVSLYSEESINEKVINTKTPDLMKYLPEYYERSSYMINLQEVNSYGIGILNYIFEDTLKQLDIDTATWGLVYYEKEFGVETNLNYSYEERRSLINALIAGQGTCTKELIKDVASKFSGGDVDVIEHFEEKYLTIKFVGVKGIPKNMELFIEMINKIRPAHLGYKFEYTYSTWGNLKNKKLAWGNAKNKTWKQLKVYE